MSPDFHKNPQNDPKKGPLGIPYGWWVIVCIAYLASPIDALPDIMPIVGWADDTGMLGFGVYCLMQWFRGRRLRRQPKP